MDATRTSEAWMALANSTTGFLVDLEHKHTTNQRYRKPGKKRVRRMQLELPYFRQQVKELELQLKRVKLQHVQRLSGQKLSPVKVEVASPSNVDIPVQKQRHDVSGWNGVAERQLKERLRAEEQQQKLKETHAELAQLNVELYKLMAKCDESQKDLVHHLSRRSKRRYWDFSSDAADEIFAEQLASVARIRLELQPAPCRTLYPNSELTMGREVVKWDPSVDAGFTMENRSQSLLPFTLDVAAQAYWRFFGCGYGEKCRVRDPADLQTDVLARSFTLRSEFEGFTTETRGKFTCRKYVDEEGITIAWVGGGDVLEFGGAKFDGVQVHKQGTIKLRRVAHQGPGNASYSTIVETAFETIPVFREGLEDRERQTRALISEIDRSYSKVSKSFCQKMSRVLVEEDWKATFGRKA